MIGLIPEGFTACPSFCQCSDRNGKQHFKCLANKDEIQRLPRHAHYLEVHPSFQSFNNDCVVPYLDQVEYLSFKNASRLEEVGCKSNYPNLRSLDLRLNSLASSPRILTTTIRTLLLSENKLTVVDAHTLRMLDKLKELFLEKNFITNIHAAFFAEQSGNDDYAKSQFAVLHNLEKLTLNSNLIESIATDAFKTLLQLRALNLAHNRISKIQVLTFNGLRRLENLDLCYNNLVQIEDGAFEQMQELKYLSLQHNRLTAIPRGLPMLQWLDVSHNHIATIGEDRKPEFYAIEFVTLAYNPFYCDCKILWLKEFYDRREYQKKFDSNENFVPTCALPDFLKGESWEFIDDSMFICDAISRSQSSDAVGEQRTFNPSLLTVKAKRVADTFVTVDWSIKGAPPSATVVIQFYVFGRRESSFKFVEIAIIQQGFTIKHLQPLSNYVICVIPKLSPDQDSSSISPLSFNHCVEISTQAESTTQTVSYVRIFALYIFCMIGTLIVLFVLVSLIALVGGKVIIVSDTSETCLSIDEPIADEFKAQDNDDRQQSGGDCVRKKFHAD